MFFGNVSNAMCNEIQVLISFCQTLIRFYAQDGLLTSIRRSLFVQNHLKGSANATSAI